MALVPFGHDYLIGMDAKGNAHAVRDHWPKKPSKRKTADAVCGKRVRYYGVGVVGMDDVMLFGWPPPAKRWTELNDGVRCRECFEGTNRPRIANHLDKIEVAS